MLGSRSFYAVWHGMVFEFQTKAYRDWFIANGGADYISSKDAYAKYDCRKFIKVSHNCYKHSRAWAERNGRNKHELS